MHTRLSHLTIPSLRRMATLVVFAGLLLAVAAPMSAHAAELDRDEMRALLETIDERQRNSGDYKALAYIEQKEKDKDDLLYEAVVYRRDDSDELAILFLRPRAEAGKGYLRIDKNLFFYDPTVGKWERRTERERIGGTDSRRGDFDESRLAEEFDPSYVATEKLGNFTVHHLKLKAKDDADVAYPVVHLWVDTKTDNILKRQDMALSGKLMRTSYFPKWEKMYSKSKGANIYFPKEIRIFDEVEKDNSTTIVFREIDLSSVDDSVFTKAWIESKSR